MRSGVAPVCVRLCRTPQNRRDTTADGLKDQPSSHHWPLLRQPDCCCRARRSPPAARFPHRSHPAPAASSLRGFSTRADTGPAATVTPRPASKNLHRSGPSRSNRRTSVNGASRRFKNMSHIMPEASVERPTRVRDVAIRLVNEDRANSANCRPFRRFSEADVRGAAGMPPRTKPLARHWRPWRGCSNDLNAVHLWVCGPG